MKNYLYGIFAIAFLAFTACTNEERTRESELHLWYVVRFGDDYSAEEVAEKLSALGEVQHVNLNRTIRRAYNAGKNAMPLTR